tara:strand:- start:25 stop:150 length:126 start_codon:yes stop_codon:yes gene_type:complete
MLGKLFIREGLLTREGLPAREGLLAREGNLVLFKGVEGTRQ